MVQGKTEKYFALISSLVMAVVHSLPITLTLHGGCSLEERMLYPLFHVTWWHLAVNLWCFLSLVFLYGVRWRHLVLAYGAAVVFPTVLCPSPTMGLSGVCFALMGLWASKVERKKYYQIYIWGFIAFSALCGGTNTALHVWGFAIGCVLSYIGWMIRKCRKKLNIF